MPTANEFIVKANAEIGYLETPINRTKFAAIAGDENGAAWCQIFLRAIAKQVGLPLPHTSSSTLYSIDGFRNAGRWFNTPKIGDFAYFNFDGTSISGTDHVGVVVGIPDSRTVITTEGNTGRPDGINVNGGGVWQRLRSRSYIVGYGRPEYTTSPTEPPPPPPVPLTTNIHAPVVGMASSAMGGYWEVSSDGGVFAFGGATFYGSLAGHTLNKPIVGMTSTSTGKGYWLVATDGGIFSFGDAQFFGSTGSLTLNKPIVGVSPKTNDRGYWLVAADGGVFNFNAPFYGSAGGTVLNKPVVGMSHTPSGEGYWLAAADGGIFAYGNAGFHGSAGGTPLNKPIVGIASSGDGYWLVASDGGVFAYNVPFFGSTGGIHLNQPIVGIVPTSTGQGYWLYAKDGGVFAFGDASFLGAVTSI